MAGLCSFITLCSETQTCPLVHVACRFVPRRCDSEQLGHAHIFYGQRVLKLSVSMSSNPDGRAPFSSVTHWHACPVTQCSTGMWSGTLKIHIASLTPDVVQGVLSPVLRSLTSEVWNSTNPATVINILRTIHVAVALLSLAPATYHA